jgi:hypothetical protein
MPVIAAGSTTPSVTIEVYDDVGLPVTGLDNTTLPTIRYVIEGANAAVTITLAALAAETTAYSSGGVRERAGSQGKYRLDLPTAAVATAGTRVKVYGEATGKRIVCETIDVTPVVDLALWLGTAPLAMTSQRPNVLVGAMNTGVNTLASNGLTLLQAIGPQVLVVTGATSPAFNGTYGPTNNVPVRNGKLVYLNGTATGCIWYNGTNWILSVSEASNGTNWWQSSGDETGPWAIGGGSPTGTIVVTALKQPPSGKNPTLLTVDSGGHTHADIREILGTLLTETSAGYLAAAFKKLFDVAAPVLTATSVNQTGDSFTQIGANGAGLTAVGDTRLANLDATISSRAASSVLGTPAGASVSADIASVKTDTSGVATKFGGITLLKNWLALIMGKTADSSTLTEVNATTAGAGYNNATDSLEKLQEASGGSSVIGVAIAPDVAAASQTPGQITGYTYATLRPVPSDLGNIVGRSKLWVTAKASLSDADSSALFQIEETAGLLYANGAVASAANLGSITVVDDTTGEWSFMVDETIMALLTPSTDRLHGAYWDAKVKTGNDTRVIARGRLVIIGGVTRANA